MKKFACLLLLLALAQMTLAQSLKDFNWLVGKWERQNVKPGTTAYEFWEKSKDGFDGMGFSMAGSDTTFVEKLKIVKKDGKMHYVADVRENATLIYFEITSYSKTGFISENPEHDFPKQIEYLVEGDQMTAIISAGEKKMGFVFKKVK